MCGRACQEPNSSATANRWLALPERRSTHMCQVAGNTASSTMSVSAMNCGAWKRRKRTVNSGSSACARARRCHKGKPF